MARSMMLAALAAAGATATAAVAPAQNSGTWGKSFWCCRALLKLSPPPRARRYEWIWGRSGALRLGKGLAHSQQGVTIAARGRTCWGGVLSTSPTRARLFAPPPAAQAQPLPVPCMGAPSPRLPTRTVEGGGVLHAGRGSSERGCATLSAVRERADRTTPGRARPRPSRRARARAWRVGRRAACLNETGRDGGVRGSRQGPHAGGGGRVRGVNFRLGRCNLFSAPRHAARSS